MMHLQGALYVVFAVVLLSNAYGAPMTLARAVKLAVTQPSSHVGKVPFGPLFISEDPSSSTVDYSTPLQSLLISAIDEPPPKSSEGFGETACGLEEFRNHDQRTYRVLDTAITYTQLSWLTQQLQVLAEQHKAATHIVNAEKMRVIVDVDDEISLIRARLLEAQTRMRTATLEGEVLELRNHLADLTGMSPGGLEVIPESVPALLRNEEDLNERNLEPQSHCQLKLHTNLQGLIAARDTAQLTYLIVEREADRATGLTATLPDRLATQIRADEKFGVLLEAIFELQQEDILKLAVEGKLEEWATTRAIQEPETAQTELRPQRDPQPFGGNSPDAVRPINSSAQSDSEFNGTKGQSFLHTILILPIARDLAVRQCRQLAAVAVGNEGGRDATSSVQWSSSNDMIAIVSTSGLVTALRPGRVTITGSLLGISRSVPITITEQSTGR